MYANRSCKNNAVFLLFGGECYANCAQFPFCFVRGPRFVCKLSNYHGRVFRVTRRRFRGQFSLFVPNLVR